MWAGFITLPKVRWLTILFLSSLCLAATRLNPPTFVVDTHGTPWFLKYMQEEDLDFYGDYDGYTLHDEHTILIKDGLSLEDEQEAVIHELEHVILGPGRSITETTYHHCIYITAA